MNAREALAATVHEYENSATFPRTWKGRAAAAIRYLETLNQHAWDAVNEIAEQCTFYRRDRCTWAYINGVQLGDAWHGNRIPKAVLCLDAAYRILESEKQRDES